MQNFRTIITPDKPPFTISHTDRIVSIGSCFSENIGKKFSDYKFNININPFGQQYNPYSIANAIERLLNPIPYSEKELVYHDELYHSFDHHGSFSRSSVEETLQVINENLFRASEDLKKATILFLTFGTSHVFKLKHDKRIVSNCHKLSGNSFEKALLNPAKIMSVIHGALSEVKAANSGLKIVFTVSPVRYFAFGHYENSVSKAYLFTAIHDLQQLLPGSYYFPAYELVMDDLRDYRFFAEDMLHPNYQATEYVWEKLAETMLSKKTNALLSEIDEILLAAKHKPRNPQSEGHKKFVRKNLDKIRLLENTFNLWFSEEKQMLERFL